VVIRTFALLAWIAGCATQPPAPGDATSSDPGDAPGGGDGDGDGSGDGAGEPDDDPQEPWWTHRDVPDGAAPPEAMDPARLLIRLSLDLRGVRPSLEALEAALGDPSVVDALAESYLADARFGERVMDHFSTIYLTGLDAYDVSAADYGLDDEPGFARAVGEEPLRLLAHVATEDLPWTDIVTADWTMANQTLAQAWGLRFVDEPAEGDAWRPARYGDARPAAGVLSTNSMWWRYMSNGSNANRGRANAVSRILLCNDYLSRPIEFDRNVNLLDEDAVADALRNNAGCAACHSTLDPLASYLWGFYYYIYYSALDISSYHPERELLWQDYTGVAPAYYGQPGYDLRDLGQQIAADARFPQCATEQVFSALLARDAALEDTQALSDHREALLDGGLTLRSLYRSVIASDEYRAGVDGAPASPKMTGPALLASQLEDLTGFRWTYADYEMMETDTYGLRTLAGGVDGVFVTAPAEEPMATLALSVERLAQAAAWHAVEHDRGAPDEALLFTRVRFTETTDTDPDLIAAQISDLHLRLFGAEVATDGPEVEANLDLWEALYALDGSPDDAWAGLLSVLLRDPDFLFY